MDYREIAPKQFQCWTFFIFPEPVKVKPGRRYWIALHLGGEGCGYIAARDAYPDGFMEYNPDRRDLQQLFDLGRDLNFATIVPADEPDEAFQSWPGDSK